MLNIANINYQSRVLVVENTKGFLCGAVMEKAVGYCLRVDFNADIVKFDQSKGPISTVGQIRPNIQILREFNFSPKDQRRLGHISASILLNDANSKDIIAH